MYLWLSSWELPSDPVLCTLLCGQQGFLGELQQSPAWAEVLHTIRVEEGLQLLLAIARAERLAIAVALERRNVEKTPSIDTGDEVMENVDAPQNVFSVSTQEVKETACLPEHSHDFLGKVMLYYSLIIIRTLFSTFSCRVSQSRQTLCYGLKVLGYFWPQGQ